MKTTGLDFVSAVKAVKYGLCEKVYSESADRYIYKDDENEIAQSVCSFATILATDYELINPRVPMEEVKVKAWAMLNPDGGIMAVYSSLEHVKEPLMTGNIIELTGTYQRPVKEKVKRREELICESFTPKSAVVRRHSSQLPGSVRIYAEWEEES